MVATFHLHCLGHRVKYGNPKVGNTTQKFLSTTQLCCSIEFIESFLFSVILVTYNIGIYICIYIYKVTYIPSFFVIFNCNAFSALHARHFEIRKNILWSWQADCFIVRSINWCDNVSGCLYWIHFPFYAVVFFSRKLCFLWSPCLMLIAELISLDTPGKPTVKFFLKITTPSWILLPISLEELNSIDWLLKSWWWLFLKYIFFIVAK